MSPQENLDQNLDSTPIIEWLTRARREGKLERDGLRRSLIRAYNPQLSCEESLRLARQGYHESNQSK